MRGGADKRASYLAATSTVRGERFVRPEPPISQATRYPDGRADSSPVAPDSRTTPAGVVRRASRSPWGRSIRSCRDRRRCRSAGTGAESCSLRPPSCRRFQSRWSRWQTDRQTREMTPTAATTFSPTPNSGSGVGAPVQATRAGGSPGPAFNGVYGRSGPDELHAGRAQQPTGPVRVFSPGIRDRRREDRRAGAGSYIAPE